MINQKMIILCIQALELENLSTVNFKNFDQENNSFTRAIILCLFIYLMIPFLELYSGINYPLSNTILKKK